MDELAQNQGEELTVESLAESLLLPEPDQEPAEEEAAEALQEEQEEVVAEDEESEEEAAEEASLYRVKINGEESEVSIEDLIAGYQKSGNYDQRIAEVQQDRAAAKAEMAKFNELTAQLQQRLAEMGTPEKEPDWVKMAQDDPIGMIEAKVKWEQQQAARDKARLESEQMAEQRRQQIANEQGRLLLQKAGVTDQKGAEALHAEILDGAKALGFSQEEIGGVLDHRLLLMAREVGLYRKMTAAKPAASKVPKPARAIKPGAQTSAASAKADTEKALRQKLKKEGTVEAFAAFLET